MGRRQAREAVLRTLYQFELGGADYEKAISNAAAINETLDEDSEKLGPLNTDDLKFAHELFLGTISHQGEIDGIIAALSRDWNVERLAKVDHNIMRMAIFEIIHRDDIPASVTINEAVDLAKAYGSDDSGKFVNGILGKFIKSDTAGPAAHKPAEGGIDYLKEDI